MKISRVAVKNYRCLKDVELPISELTVLLGQNGCEKSCVFSALNLFYNTNIKVEKYDFYDGNISEDIIITVHFSDLTPLEKKLFAHYSSENELSVEKVIKFSETRPIQKYHGTRYVHPQFDAFRNASGAGLKSEYEKLRKIKDYENLPPYQNKDEANRILQEWELSNKQLCEQRRDDGQFFGFQNVGMHKLEKYTQFLFIPAVQEASEEALEQKGSIFEQIMEIVVKSALASNEEINKLQEDAELKYKELIEPSKNKNLIGLEGELTNNLAYFVPDSAVKIEWIEAAGIQINPPRAYVKLKEGGYANTVDRCGHGLQRAYILALFQQLAVIQAEIALKQENGDHNDATSSSLIIGIEEPELYQHPDRQRHFAQTLLKLSQRGFGGLIDRIQVLYFDSFTTNGRFSEI